MRFSQCLKFSAGTAARLMVGSAHDHSHFVCKQRIFKMIHRKIRTPHRRPDIVTLQAQQQFKNMFVKFRCRLGTSKFFLRPISETRLFIVNEKSTVAHTWLFGNCLYLLIKYNFFFLFRHGISPEHPRRDTDFLRNVKHPVSCAPLITSRDHKYIFPLFRHIFEAENPIHFFFASNLAQIHFFLRFQFCQYFTAVTRRHQDVV